MNMIMNCQVTGVTFLDFTPDGGEPVRRGELHVLEPLDTRRGGAAGDRTTVIECDFGLAQELVKSWHGPLQFALEMQNVTDRKGSRKQVCVGARVLQAA